MSKADEMFKELGMLKTLDNDDIVIYRLKDDYRDYSIHFDKKLKRFHYTCSHSIFNDQATWEAMNKNNEFRDDFDKYCSKYGYWGSFPNDIGMELLQAINEKCKELRMDMIDILIQLAFEQRTSISKHIQDNRTRQCNRF